MRELADRLDLGERVLFLGRKPRAEIPRMIRSADGTVLPSEWYENAPLSLLESLALGRPVIASPRFITTSRPSDPAATFRR